MLDNGFSKKFGISIEQFEEYILNAETINEGRDDAYKLPNIERLREGTHSLGVDFSDLQEWDLNFEKIEPKDSQFVDSLDLYKYWYNDSLSENERVPIFAIVPPEAKQSLLEELEYANVTTATVYPDMDVVAKELLRKYAVQKF